MIIANPIYDVVFKRMMENERIARFIIGTLLNQTVLAVKVKPQELTYKNKPAGLAVFRLDFIATIKTEGGDMINVLIEIQKAKNDIDVMRFRNYVAEQYKREDIVDGESVPLPIITIYILGYNLEELPLSYTEIKRQYRDGITKTPVSYKSNFVENLTHDSYVVQVERITGKHQTKIEKLLSIFEQTNFVDDGKIRKEYTYDTDIEEVKIVTDFLHEVGCNAKDLKQIEVEQEAWRSVNAMFASKEKIFRKTLKEKDKSLVEKDKVIDESKKVIDEKDKVIDESKKVIDEKDKVIDESKKALDEKDKVIDESKKVIDEKDKVIDESKKALDEKDKVIAKMARQLEESKQKRRKK